MKLNNKYSNYQILSLLSILYYNKYFSKMSSINFKDLKKELKDIDKISKDNLDIRTWKSDLELWIELGKIEDSEKIYYACVLTSIGEPRKINQELMDEINIGNYDERDNEENDDDDDDNEEEEEVNEAEGEEGSTSPEKAYPSLNQIVKALEDFYGIREDQNNLIRELRALRIKRNERIKDFNIRYKTLYLKLNKNKRHQISVLDYTDSIENNVEAWKRIALFDDIPLSKAFKIAEKADRLNYMGNNQRRHSSSSSQPTSSSSFNANRNYNNYPMKRNFEQKVQIKRKEDNDIEEITRKMKNLTIKACYFCKEQGHYQNNCPKLKAIVDKNRNEIRNNRLN